MSALLSFAYGLMSLEFGRRAWKEYQQTASGYEDENETPSGAAALVAEAPAADVGAHRRAKKRQLSAPSVFASSNSLNYGGVFASHNANALGALGVAPTRDMRLSNQRITAANMRAESSAFAKGPAKATLHKNVGSLEGRVKRIRGLIVKGAKDPAVRNTAISVLSRRCPGKPGGWCVSEKDWRAEAEALFAFTRKNVRYTRDSILADTYVHPARTLFDVKPGSGGGGDCDDYVITLGALLMSVGHEVKMRVGAIKNPGAGDRPGWNHIWLVNTLPSGGAVASRGGNEMVLDASVDKPPGWEAPKSAIYKVRDFKVT
jgi:hypothetical protein